MKMLWSLLFLPLFSLAQIIEYEGDKYVMFSLKHQVDSASATRIDFHKENLLSHIQLNGPTPLDYTIRITNDSTALISKYENGTTIDTEKIEITEWIIRRDTANHIISDFKITDFDDDGDEDILCWVFTNVNGNVWTIILLNDNANGKLVKLRNNAEETYIWDRPVFNKHTATIHTTLDASVFGVSNEATYKLQGTVAAPLTKEEEDRSSGKIIVSNKYIGENGKWKLIKSKKIR